jgi:hypothetical protein
MTALGDALSAPGYVVTDAEQKQKIQLVLLNFIASFNNRIRYTTDQFKTEMLTQLQALGLTSSDIQGTSIERTIRIAALDTRDAWQGAAAAKNFADINAMVESGQMTQAELVILLTTVAGRVSDPTFANALIENLANRHHPEDIYMLNILSKYRYQLAATKLASAELKPAIIESLKAFYHHQDNANFREVFNQLWAKGIHLQDHVSHIWLLSNSVFGSDFRQASQLDTLVRNAAILHITLDELLENEAVRSHVAPALLQQNWLFDATQGHYAGIGVKLLKSRIVDGINHDRNWSEDIENVARHAEAIRSLPETQELIATLSRLHTARPWDQNIGAAMVRLSMVGLIQHSELQQLDQTTLIGQLNTTDVRFKAFVVNQLITRFHTSEFPEAVLEQIATLLVNDNAETVPDSDLVYSRMAADILMRVRTHNQNVQNELKASATEDDDVQIAIPAAIGFIRNGGNVGEIQAVMETIRDNLAAMENAPASLISLMQTLEGLVNPPGQNPAQCAAFVQ